MQLGLLRNNHPASHPRTRSRGAAALAMMTALAGAHLVPIEVTADLPPGYTGKPYKDSILEVPGRIRLFRFDEGAKEMVWHDYEASNKWYCKVRTPAAVGLQLMGAGGDKWEPGKAESGMTLVKDDCYMAETNSGDWTKYTVRVKAKGTYSMSFLEAAQGTTVPFVGVSFMNGADSVGTGRITLPLTSYFHNWVYAKGLASIALDTGLQVMRFDILGNGPMNINYIDFAPSTGTPILDQAGAGRKAGPALRRADRLPDGRLRVAVETGASGALRIDAIDLGGKVLWTHAVPDVGAGRHEIDFRPAGMAGGLAFLRARQGSAWSASRTLPPGP